MDAGTLPIPPEHRALTAAYLARLRKDPPHA